MSDLSTAAGTWNIDPAHTSINFVVRHAMISKVRGSFNEFAGSFTIDGANIAASSASLTIQAASIDTGNADRDGHLTSPDFLDIATFPTLSFTSTSVATKGDDILLTGDLTIRGVTKPVTIEFEYHGTQVDPWGNTKVGFEGKAEISRKDFDLTWNAVLEGGGVLVGDTVKLEFDVQAAKA